MNAAEGLVVLSGLFTICTWILYLLAKVKNLHEKHMKLMMALVLLAIVALAAFGMMLVVWRGSCDAC